MVSREGCDDARVGRCTRAGTLEFFSPHKFLHIFDKVFFGSPPLRFACHPLGPAMLILFCIEWHNAADVRCFATSAFQQGLSCWVSSLAGFPPFAQLILYFWCAFAVASIEGNALLCWRVTSKHPSGGVFLMFLLFRKPHPHLHRPGSTLFLLVSCTIKSPLLIVDAFAFVACLFWPLSFFCICALHPDVSLVHASFMIFSCFLTPMYSLRVWCVSLLHAGSSSDSFSPPLSLSSLTALYSPPSTPHQSQVRLSQILLSDRQTFLRPLYVAVS